MQNRTASDLEHLYSDGEVASHFHQLWQEEGWPAGNYVELWLKAGEMVEAARRERAGQAKVLPIPEIPAQSGPDAWPGYTP